MVFLVVFVMIVDCNEKRKQKRKQKRYVHVDVNVIHKYVYNNEIQQKVNENIK